MEGEIFYLTKSSDAKYLGASPGSNSDQVILTDARGVYIYDVDGKKKTHSFMCPNNRKLTCAAVRRDKSKSYYAAIGTKVATWKNDEIAQLDETTTVSQDFGALHSIHSGGVFELCVVTANGTIQFLDENLKAKISKKPSFHQVLSAQVSGDGSPMIVNLTVREKESSPPTIVLYLVSNTMVADLPRLELQQPKDTFIKFSTFDYSSRTLAVLWSNGTLQFYYVSHTLRSEDSKTVATIPVTPFANYHLSAYQLSTNPADKDIFALETKHGLAILGKSKKNSQELLFTLWNPIYGTLLNSTNFPISGSKGNHQLVGACVLDRFPVFVLESSVVVVPLGDVPAVSLASQLGNGAKLTSFLQDTTPFAPLVQSDIDLAAQLDSLVQSTFVEFTENQQALLPFQEQITKGNQQAQSFMKKLLDPNQTPDQKTFSQVWVELFGKPKKNPALYNFGKEDLSRLLVRCVSGKFIQQLQYLIRHQYITANGFPELLDSLIESKNTDMLSMCVATLQDISPTDLVRLLEYFATNPELDTSVRKSNVSQLMQISLSSLLLQQTTRYLSLETVEFLLNTLGEYLQQFYGEEHTLSKDIPPLHILTKWLNLLFDSHFATFALTPRCHPTILSIAQLIRAEVSVFPDLQALALQLSRVLEQQKEVEKRSGYSIIYFDIEKASAVRTPGVSSEKENIYYINPHIQAKVKSGESKGRFGEDGTVRPKGKKQ